MSPNERTQIADPRRFASLATLEGRWEEATHAAALERRRDLDKPAILVVAAWRDEANRLQLKSWLRTPSVDGGPLAVTVGGHTHSDVGPIHGASLRHLLVIADPARRGPLLDVIDLFTPNGFEADGAQGVRRVQSLDVQRVRAGTADVLAVYLAPGDDVDRGLRTAEQRGALTNDKRAAPAIMSRQPSLDLGVSVVAGVQARRPATVDKLLRRLATREGVTRVMGEADDRGVIRVRPTPEELANGFIIGRSERCSVQGNDANLSRVHAFVMGRGDGLLVVDAGSTNGTWVIEGDTEVELDRGHRACVVGARARLRCGDTIVEILVTDR